MHVVQEGQRLQTLMELVAQGLGVAIIPGLFSRPPIGVVLKTFEDFDLPANLHMMWLRRNDSALLKDFIATTRQVASTARASLLSSKRQISDASAKPRPKPSSGEARLSPA
jgi:DNA-binding transcriptional LysR family regulator